MKSTIKNESGKGYVLTVEVSEHDLSNILQTLKFIEMGRQNNWGSFKTDYNAQVAYWIKK
jgi:hypothetical protein